MSDDRPAHLEVYFWNRWHVWHGQAAEAAWCLLFMGLFFGGWILGFIFGYFIEKPIF